MSTTNKKPKSAPNKAPAAIRAIKKAKLSFSQKEDISTLLDLSRNMASLLRAYENIQWIDEPIGKLILDKHTELKNQRDVVIKRMGLL